MFIWEGKHLSSTEKIIIIFSTFSFLAGLFIFLLLAIRSLLGGSSFSFEDVVFVFLLVVPAIYTKKRANERLLHQSPQDSTDANLDLIKKENIALSYASSSVKGTWIMIGAMFLLPFFVFLWWLFR